MVTSSPTAPTTTTLDFESIYAAAGGDPARIPWARERPHPALVSWLNAIAPSLIRCGSRVAVVGCGLGHDAQEILRRGYDVTAFDCSETAIDWARRLDPVHADAYHVADLLHAPSRWRHRFDLVVEVNTLQSLPSDQRQDAMHAVTDLLSPHGRLLVICRGAEEPPALEDGPPWPLAEDELATLASVAGLEDDGGISIFEDGETPPVLRMRALFQRARG